MKLGKLIRLLPFVILVIILMNTWYRFFTRQNTPLVEHYWALGFVLSNGILYFVNFRYGILLTGLILCLALFGIIVFDPLKTTTYYGMTIAGTEIRTPYIVPVFLLLLLVYISVNAKAFMNFYLDYMDRKNKIG